MYTDTDVDVCVRMHTYTRSHGKEMHTHLHMCIYIYIYDWGSLRYYNTVPHSVAPTTIRLLNQFPHLGDPKFGRAQCINM